MPSNQINLADLIGAASSVLAQNKGTLNKADAYNQNHGDNMVQIFDLINQAIGEKPKAKTSEQLAYASQKIRSQTNSGSAQVYSKALETAASQFKGQNLTTDNALALITTLLGGGQTPQATLSRSASSGNADLLTSLLGGLMGASGTQTSSSSSSDMIGDLLGGLMGASGTQASSSSSSDMIGDLLGGLMGGSSKGSTPTGMSGTDLLGSLLGGMTSSTAQRTTAKTSQKSSGLDTSDLLRGGMAYMSSKQRGASTAESLLDAVISGSPLGETPQRAQSAKMVGSALLSALTSYVTTQQQKAAGGTSGVAATRIRRAGGIKKRPGY